MGKRFFILGALGTIVMSGCGTYQMMPMALNCGSVTSPTAEVKAVAPAPRALAQTAAKVCPPEPLCFYEIYTSDASMEASSANSVVVSGVSFQPFVFHIDAASAAAATPASITPESKCYDPSSKEWVYGKDPASVLAKLGCQI